MRIVKADRAQKFMGFEADFVVRLFADLGQGLSRCEGTARTSVFGALTFYVNRAGRSLPDQHRQTLDQAKAELCKLFHREPKR